MQSTFFLKVLFIKTIFMRKLIYHIATSLDGYIAHPDGSVDGFLMQGPHAEEFFQSLSEYDTVLMGRGTYDFGLKMGLKLGKAPYPMLQNYVLSKHSNFEKGENIEY